ncbi:hypothetical protein ACGFZP_19475 [Kitasatospora sp. NPDC048239]|uniref:hypothetical protein n=1 Tax=Kitasatospora sp. NPDC048239 TaxID=3364046 RepID=UPI0037194501
MKSSIGTAVRPALVSLLLLGAAACGPDSGAPQAASAAVDAVAPAVPAAASPAGAPTARSGAGAPRAASTPTTAPPASQRPAAGTLPVAAAQPGVQQVAIGTPGKEGAAVSSAASALQLAAYDPVKGTAVLSGAPVSPAPAQASSPTTVPTAPPAAPPTTVPASTPASPSAPSSGVPAAPPPAGQVAAVKPGQLIASPPTAAAPQGALVAVTEVRPGAGDTVGISTRPATLAELLGGAEADGQVAVDPQAIRVTPLVKDLKATVGRENGTTRADASGTLEVDVKAPIPLPDGASADASGSLQLHPAVHFAYHGAGVGSPRTASIGFDLGAHAQWKVTGDLGRATGTPVRLPFAKLQASPVLTVAGLPVVVNLGLTCYLEISADGKVHLEAEQEVTGAWSVRADYAGDRGWSPVTDAGNTTVSPVRLRLSGKAAVRAGLGAEVSVGLYDTVGVEATLAPYLRGQVDGSIAVDTSGNPPQVQGSWGLFGGIDLNGSLLAHLKVFGTPLVEGRLPLPSFHREWPLLTGALPSPRPTG